MGPVSNNFDKLVKQPTGCGEQNMVKLAPLKSIAAYLTDTLQINSKTINLIKEYLITGYQKQLSYRHHDGSFSAFGPSYSNGKSGGTWLTAFVLRVFVEAYKLNLIEINEKDIISSLEFLFHKTQDENGAFKQVGAHLFSQALAGGLNDQNVGLSAYVLLSILKSVDALNTENYQKKIKKGIEYLKSSINNNTDTYTLALSLYVLKFYDNNDKHVIYIDKELDKRCISESNYKWISLIQLS